jgi:hypothetical protein
MYKARTLEEIFGEKMKEIDSVRVLYVYEDKYSLSYLLEYIVEGKKYINFDMRCGDQSRMYYQSEISKHIRDTILKPYIHKKILDSQTYVDL